MAREKRLTIGQRLFRRSYTEEIGKVSDALEMIADAYRSGPGIMSSETLAANIQEMDSHLLDMLVRQRGWQVLSGGMGIGSETQFTEQDRLRAVSESRWMTHYDVQTRRALESWTDFGFGQTIDIKPLAENAQEVWEEFWTAPRNASMFKQRKLQQLSNVQLKDGEQYFVFYTSLDGETTIRRFKTDEIAEIIYEDPDSTDVPLFYVRREDKERVLYPDWQATPEMLDGYERKAGEVRADQRSEAIEFEVDDRNGDPETITEYATRVVVLHAALNEENGRGWPQFTSTFPWTRAYKEFLQDRATVTKAVASTVDEMIHKQGSRKNSEIINQIASTLSSINYSDTNPPPAAGSTLVHNDAIDVKRRPLTTGAGDAQTDGMTLLGQVSAGDVLPLHWRGRPDAMQNRATAREQERPWLEAMQRYQTFWKDVFGDMVEIVLIASGKKFSELGAEVEMQSPFVIDPEEAAAAIDAINGAATAGTLAYEVAEKAVEVILVLLLTTYGISNTDEILEKEPESVATEPEKKAAAGIIKKMNDGEVEPAQVAEYFYSIISGI